MKNNRAFRAFLLAGVASLLTMAATKADTIYVSDSGANTVTMIASNGTQTTFGSGDLNGPTGIAVDPLTGILYVANNGGQVAEFTQSGTFLGDLPETFNNPRGLAFDSSGNLFIANQSSNSISEVTAGGVVSTFLDTDLDFPNGLAFDSAGNLFVANGNGDNNITVVTPGGIPSTLNVTGHPLNNPNGIAFDSAGNLYVANNSDPSIEKITAGGAGSVFTTAGLSGPKGLTIDSNGDIWVSDYDNNEVTEYNSLGTLIGTFTGLTGPCYLTAVPSLSVPEPSTYAMLIAGLGMVVYLNRRRHQMIPVKI